MSEQKEIVSGPETPPPGEGGAETAEREAGGWFSWLILLILAGVVAWLWLYPFHDPVTGDEAVDALAAYKAGSYKAAWAKLEELIAKAPGEPETLRATGNLLQGSDPFQAFLAMKKLQEVHEVTPEEERLFIRLAQGVRKTHLADEALGKLLKGSPDDPELLFLEARGKLLAFQGMEALVLVEKALDRFPTHRPCRLLRARLLTLSPGLVLRLQGKTELKDLAEEEQDRIGLEALQFLMETPRKPVWQEERKKVLLQIERHQLSSDSGRLAALGRRLGNGQVEPGLLDEIMEKYRGQPALLGTWLAKRNLQEQALSLFSLEAVRKRPELFGIWFSILLDSAPEQRGARLQEADQLLLEAKGMMPEARHDLFGAVLRRVEGNRKESRILFERTLDKVVTLPEEEHNGFLDTLAEKGLAAGEFDFSLRVLRKRFTGSIGEDAPYEACERYFATAILNKKTEEALSIAKQIKQRFPAEIAARNNLAYLKLILGKEVGETVAEVESLAANGPPFPGLLTTLALARLRTGKKKAALEAITPGGVQILFRTDADKAVCVAVLRANGKDKQAVQIFETISTERLLPQEKLFLELSAIEQPRQK